MITQDRSDNTNYNNLGFDIGILSMSIFIYSKAVNSPFTTYSKKHFQITACIKVLGILIKFSLKN